MGSLLSSQSQLPPAGSSAAAAAAASPGWMLIAPYGGGYGKACNITGDSKTIAAAATSNGHRISVSLRRDPFSALSRICLCLGPGTDWPWASYNVIAAHGGIVLMRITSQERYLAHHAYDYFVYSNVGAAAADPARPPSLYLLRGPARRWLDISATDLLGHGEADFVVAELTVVGSKEDVKAAAAAARLIAFELLLFQHGKWCVKRPWIIDGDGHSRDSKTLWARWETIATVPVSNGMLCWVDRYSGVIFSDVLHEGPSTLRYVSYPAESRVHRRERLVCTDVRGALKLVSMAPHRCSQCGCSEHDTAFTIWTLKMDEMAWVLETETNKVVDSTDLWVLPDTPGFARTHLVYPVESMNGGSHIVMSTSGGGDNVSDESDDVSDVSSAPMEDEDEDRKLSVSTLTATPSLPDGLRGSNGETSASTGDHQQGDNEPATEGRWPKRSRKANSMVTGPEWITK